MKKIVLVTWVDSTSTSHWQFPEDLKDEVLIRVTSIGFLVKETSDYIMIAQNYGDNPEQYSNITTIPRVSILKMNELDESVFVLKFYKKV